MVSITAGYLLPWNLVQCNYVNIFRRSRPYFLINDMHFVLRYIQGYAVGNTAVHCWAILFRVFPCFQLLLSLLQVNVHRNGVLSWGQSDLSPTEAPFL